jgi:hypothetical protein
MDCTESCWGVLKFDGADFKSATDYIRKKQDFKFTYGGGSLNQHKTNGVIGDEMD